MSPPLKSYAVKFWSFKLKVGVYSS